MPDLEKCFSPVTGCTAVSFAFAYLPRNIQTGEWYHYCMSYSSILGKMYNYGNGLKISEYDFQDEVEEPLPKHMFHYIKLCQNFRGMITDLNIFPRFFDDKEMFDSF